MKHKITEKDQQMIFEYMPLQAELEHSNSDIRKAFIAGMFYEREKVEKLKAVLFKISLSKCINNKGIYTEISTYDAKIANDILTEIEKENK